MALREFLSLLKNLHYIWFLFNNIAWNRVGSFNSFSFCYHFLSKYWRSDDKNSSVLVIFMIPQGPIFLKLKSQDFQSIWFLKKAPYPTPSWAVFYLESIYLLL